MPCDPVARVVPPGCIPAGRAAFGPFAECLRAAETTQKGCRGRRTASSASRRCPRPRGAGTRRHGRRDRASASRRHRHANQSAEGTATGAQVRGALASAAQRRVRPGRGHAGAGFSLTCRDPGRSVIDPCAVARRRIGTYPRPSEARLSRGRTPGRGRPQWPIGYAQFLRRGRPAFPSMLKGPSDEWTGAESRCCSSRAANARSFAAPGSSLIRRTGSISVW